MKKLIALVLFATPLFAQVTVHSVNDRRTSGSFSQLVLQLELPKVKSADVAASRVLVTAATDDKGNNLVDPEAQEPELEPNRHDSQHAPNAMVSLTLKNPDRKAAKVKEIRGEIELYMPSKDANSVAEIAKFTSFSGKALNHRALKANEIEIAVLSPAQIEAERKKLGDAKRKEYAADGLEGESLDSLVKSYMESALAMEENDILLRLKDPKQRIQEIAYVDGAGEKKFVSVRDHEGFTLLSTWEGKPAADWKLRVSMKTAKNTVRQPFTVTDVPLP